MMFYLKSCSPAVVSTTKLADNWTDDEFPSVYMYLMNDKWTKFVLFLHNFFFPQPS